MGNINIDTINTRFDRNTTEGKIEEACRQIASQYTDLLIDIYKKIRK